MIRSLLVALLALLLPAAALAQPVEASNDLWRRDGERISFTTARFSFPTELGSLRLSSAAEFSNTGRGIDSGLQYRSADGELLATVYVYYPGLSHAGLTAFMTDYAIYAQGGNTRTLGTQITAAGGHEGVAIRTDYSGYRNGLASSAAFIKAGRWIIKLRISGPEARRAEVEGAMAVLLGRMRFEGEIRPRAAAPIEIGACETAPAGPARARPNSSADAAQAAIMATVDGGGEVARPGRDRMLEAIPTRVGRHWCPATRLTIGQVSYPVLRARPGEAGDGLRTALVVLITDAGRMVELIEMEGRFMLLHHNLGRTDILGSYEGVLSDAQLADLLTGADRSGGQTQASVEFLANGNTNITIRTLEDPPAPRPES